MSDRARKSYTVRKEVRETVASDAASDPQGGLADDYYRDHPAAPRGRTNRRYDYGDDRSPSPLPVEDRGRSRSRMRRALDALEVGGVTGAIQAFRSRSQRRSRSQVSRRSLPLRRRGSLDSLSSQSDTDMYVLDRHSSSYIRERDSRPRSRPRRRLRSRSRSLSSSRDRDSRLMKRRASSTHASGSRRDVIEQAAGAALITAAVEAFRLRHDHGPWVGDKGGRVVTAALGAGAIEAGLASRNPDRHVGRNVIVSAIGGLLLNRVANGKDPDRHDRR
jgi:hypothetical protein